MTRSIFIMEDTAITLEDYKSILVEINMRYREGSLDKLARDAILKRVTRKIEELSSEEHN